jgi:cytochrome c oxidase assembly protein subunit 15
VADDPADSRRGTADTDAAWCRRLASGFALLVALTFGLIVLGALVRAHDAGLACPDWPLCFGELVPRMNLRVAFEWTHRLVAGSLALVFAGLATLALRRRASREASARLLLAAGLLLLVQVLLGALTVWQLLAAWTVTSHLLAGNAFAATLLLVCLALRARARGDAAASAPAAARALAAAAGVLLLVQMLLGGLVASRYAGLACPDWPACWEGAWFPTFEGDVGLQLLHRWNAALVVAALLGLAAAARAAGAPLRRLAVLAAALGVCQLGVGVANVWLRLPVEVTGLHSALAAALVLTLTAAAHQCWGRAAPPAAPARPPVAET